jgi:hypothetical protein
MKRKLADLTDVSAEDIEDFIVKVMSLDDDGILKIEVDTKDIKACEFAALKLYIAMERYHGSAAANEVMNRTLRGKQQLKYRKNLVLLTTALRRLRAAATTESAEEFAAAHAKGFTWDRSVEQVAAEIAAENKSRPIEARYGPSGSTTTSTIAKQIRRLLRDAGLKE